ncbi:MAG: hypothetical protein QOK35_2735 [Pseudonocardiales bacterium]|nr:hypothetical protein [Pseudonocardiales bacterium]
MTDTATLIAQLRVLAHLTRAEAHVARLRTTQATGDDARDELRQDAADANARAARIDDALRDLGALPDPVAPVFGRAAALVRGALEQVQPLDEALFADLALQHQLYERARHAGALADAAGLPAVRALADDLVLAHADTVDWLHGVLDDLSTGRSAALAASPWQQVAAQVTRTANTPAQPVPDDATATTPTAAAPTLTTTATPTAAVTVAAREPEPAPEPDPVGPPIPGFAEFSAHAAVAALRTLDPAAAATALTFEQAHGNRPAVVAAARIRAGAASEA